MFVESETTNIVRNLNRFLKEAFDEIVTGAFSEFNLLVGETGEEVALSHDFSAGEERREVLHDIIFGQVLRLLPSPPSFSNSPVTVDAVIRRIVHSEILENPFRQTDVAGSFFPLTIRIETDNGTAHLYSATVYMSVNPFDRRQFFFAPNAPR